MNSEELQSDEMQVLQSICTEEEFTCEIGADGLWTGKIYAFLDLPQNFTFKYKTYSENGSSTVVVPLQHLPPIILSFKLPKTYPTETMPEYTLSCPWISVTKMTKLCAKLDNMWELSEDKIILFPWMDFLKRDSLKFMGFQNELDISRRHFMELKKLGLLDQRKGPRRQPNRTVRKEPHHQPIDNRIILFPTTSLLCEYLQSYDIDRSTYTFLQSFYLCNVCFQDVQGSNCLRFSPCGHVYCKKCMGEYFKTRISGATVTSMPCPTDKCAAEADPQQIKDCVDSNLFNEYDKLLLTVTLDKMEDITYCPRLTCGSPVMKENDDKMAACPACCYVFCIVCKRAYHGVAPCRFKSVEVKGIVEEYENGDQAVKLMMEKRYGRAQIQGFINDMLSANWVDDKCKNCPKCGSSIEKSSGCNKMACGKCQTFFCWLCLAILDTAKPYNHFSDVNSKCRNKLFFGLEVEEDEENIHVADGLDDLLDDEDDVDYQDFIDGNLYYFDGDDDDDDFHIFVR